MGRIMFVLLCRIVCVHMYVRMCVCMYIMCVNFPYSEVKERSVLSLIARLTGLLLQIEVRLRGQLRVKVRSRIRGHVRQLPCCV